jgi:hypothetical protein
MTDITRSGRRDYDDLVRARVIDTFVRLSRNGERAVQVDDIAGVSGVPGRTIRQIMTDADGSSFVLGGGDEGYCIAQYAEDADALTQRIENQANTMLERVARRKQAAVRLARRQNSLF